MRSSRNRNTGSRKSNRSNNHNNTNNSLQAVYQNDGQTNHVIYSSDTNANNNNQNPATYTTINQGNYGNHPYQNPSQSSNNNNNNPTQIVRYGQTEAIPLGNGSIEDVYHQNIGVQDEIDRNSGVFSIQQGQIGHNSGPVLTPSYVIEDPEMRNFVTDTDSDHLDHTGGIITTNQQPQPLKYPKVPAQLYQNASNSRHSSTSVLDNDNGITLTSNNYGAGTNLTSSVGNRRIRGTSDRSQSASAASHYPSGAGRTKIHYNPNTHGNFLNAFGNVTDNSKTRTSSQSQSNTGNSSIGSGNTNTRGSSKSQEPSSSRMDATITSESGGINEVSPKKEVQNFIQKLASMLEKAADKINFPQYQTSDGKEPLISWNGPDSFIIREPNKFTKDMVPAFFKSNKRESFIRQLNTYGFRKITNIENDNLMAENQQWEEVLHYTHAHFTRDNKENWVNIRRRRADRLSNVNKNDDGQGDSSPQPTLDTDNSNMLTIMDELRKLSEHNKIVQEQMMKLSKDNEMLKEQNAQLFERDRKNKNNIANVVHLLSKLMKRRSKNGTYTTDLPELMSAVSYNSENNFNFTRSNSTKAITNAINGKGDTQHTQLITHGQIAGAMPGQLTYSGQPGHVTNVRNININMGNVTEVIGASAVAKEEMLGQRAGKRSYASAGLPDSGIKGFFMTFVLHQE